MELYEILLALFFGLLIWSWILYEIIKMAIRSQSPGHLMQIQIRLLAELLIKTGVDKERVKEIINLKKEYFTEGAKDSK